MKQLLLGLLFFPICALAYFPEQPTLTPLFEFQLYTGYTRQHYKKVGTHSVDIRDHYFDGALSISVTPVLETGIGMGVLKTTGRKTFINDVNAYVKYLVLDDLVGDKISLTINAQIRAPMKKALVSFGRFYQGRLEGIGSVSFGKEAAYGPLFTTRFWGLLGLGVSNEKSWFSPGSFSVQANWKNRLQVTGFARGSMGYGKKKSINPAHFKGYQRVRYRALDVGANLIVFFGVWGDLTVEYAKRVHSRRAPDDVHLWTFRYHFPFSIF